MVEQEAQEGKRNINREKDHKIDESWELINSFYFTWFAL